MLVDLSHQPRNNESVFISAGGKGVIDFGSEGDGVGIICASIGDAGFI